MIKCNYNFTKYIVSTKGVKLIMIKKNYCKFIVYILTLCISLSLLSQRAAAAPKDGKINVNARCAIALDCKTKIVLFEKNADSLVPIASTTKIMTALVAIKYGDLDKKVIISDKAANIHGSTVGYKKGEMVSIRELLFGLMLRSGNDASIAVSEGVAGTVEEFVKLMNEYALQLGLINTHFEVPHGLDEPYHYSTAYDLALVTAKAKELPIFNEIVGAKEADGKNYGFTRSYRNINKILWLLPAADGVKTGYTGNAGKCLVTSAKLKGNDIVIVTLNCNGRWNETKKIYDYVNKNYEYKKFFSKDEKIDSIKVNSMRKHASLICGSDIVIPVKKSDNYSVKIQKPSGNIKTSISGYKQIGSVEIYQEDKLVYKEPLKVKRQGR